ncbi:protein kinase [Streptomyces sp. NPDC049813]|uniref:serine/threonine-protein kinase n=1 Tax=Streptomyces sp. NPDC049813 TaxID=3365597 RepID=UPI0037AC624B
MQPLETDDPATVGPYRLLGRLGHGGMGRVYLGRSAGGRTVAVKVVHPHFALDEEFRARFRREVDAARRVGGAWTAPVLDADPDARVPWVATGYVAGPSLAQAAGPGPGPVSSEPGSGTGGPGSPHGGTRPGRPGPLPEHSVRVLGAGLAEALAAVHGLGLVHRDVKPSNVLLTVDGPRLIDFGIARATDNTASLTSTGVSIGSPGYMAPEQILGKGVTGAADLFSLGAVLVYAATGESPFRGDSSAALLYKVVHEEPELGALTGDIREVAAACLVKDPAARPAPGEVARRLAPDGAARLVAAGWLPGALVEQVSRSAVQLLDLEGAPGAAPLSGPVGFAGPSVGGSPEPGGVFGPPDPGYGEFGGPGGHEGYGRPGAAYGGYGKYTAGPESGTPPRPSASASGSGAESWPSTAAPGSGTPPRPSTPPGSGAESWRSTPASESGAESWPSASASGSGAEPRPSTPAPGSGAESWPSAAAPGSGAESWPSAAASRSGAEPPPGPAAESVPPGPASRPAAPRHPLPPAPARDAAAREPEPQDSPPGRFSVSVSAASAPASADGRGRRLSCSVALAVAGALAAVTVGGVIVVNMLPDDSPHTGAGADHASPSTSAPPMGSAPPDGSAPPTGPAQPSGTAPGPPGAADVPSFYLGVWNGPAVQAGIPFGTFRVDLKQTAVGRRVGTVTSTDPLGIRCVDVLTLTSADGKSLVAKGAAAPDNPGTCAQGTHTVRLTRDGDALKYSSRYPQAGNPTADLARVPR